MKVSIQNLKQGLSSFSEKISSDFIDKQYSHYYPNDLNVSVELDKIERDFRLQIEIKSIARFECDRCLNEYDSQIDLHQEQIYKTGAAVQDTSEDIIMLPVDALEIDITDILNEMLILNHPIKMLCKEDCFGICPDCGTNLNENKCQCNENHTDARWDELRKLIK